MTYTRPADGNSSSFARFNPTSSSSDDQGAYRRTTANQSTQALATTASSHQVGTQALEPYRRSNSSSSSALSSGGQSQSALSTATAFVQSSTSRDIALPQSHFEQSALITRKFKDDLDQDRRIFAEVQRNLQKVTIDVFKTRELVRVAIEKFAKDAKEIIDEMKGGFKKLAHSYSAEKGLAAAGIDGLHGLVDIGERIIKVSKETSEQHQKALDSSCNEDGSVFGKLISLNFDTRAKELDLFGKRLEYLRTHQDAELDRIVKIHGLKLEAEAQMFEHLTALAELELKSDQQDFNQQKELLELENKVFEAKEQIRLQEVQLANDKELALIYADVQKQLQTQQIDADMRCNLARVAAKEAVQMARTQAEKESREYEARKKAQTEIYVAGQNARVAINKDNNEKDVANNKTRANLQYGMHKTQAEKEVRMHQTSAEERTRQRQIDAQRPNILGIVARVIPRPPCSIM